MRTRARVPTATVRSATAAVKTSATAAAVKAAATATAAVPAMLGERRTRGAYDCKACQKDEANSKEGGILHFNFLHPKSASRNEKEASSGPGKSLYVI